MFQRHLTQLLTLSIFLSISIIAAPASFSHASSTKASLSSAEISKSMRKLSMPFVKNEGQVDNDVSFYAKTLGGTLFVTSKGELVYSLPKSEGEEKKALKKDEREPLHKEGRKTSLGVIKESLVGAEVKGIKGIAPSDTKVNYFTGSDSSKHRSGVQTYGIVDLGEIYKGIGLKLKAYGDNVEKLFYVKPEGNVSDIAVKVEGGKLRVNESGELEVKTKLGVVKFTKPIAYQDIGGNRVEVAVTYQVAEKEDGPASYGFQVGEYDKAYELVIDPLLASTYIGGGRYVDYVSAVALDQNGNVYIAGQTESTGFHTTPGAYDRNNGGSYDGFVSKLSGDLSQVLASTYIGGSGGDYVSAIALDQSGNVYIAGNTWSTGFPTTPGVYDTSYNGRYNDVFVSKLNGDLTQLLASTFISSGSGSYSYDYVYAIALDQSGNVYIAGETQSTGFPTTPGAYDRSYNGGSWEGFVSKLSGDLSQLLASTYIRGSGSDTIRAIALDQSGNVYIAGTTDSPNFPTTIRAYDTSLNDYDGFVSKLSGDLSQLLASTYIGGNNRDFIRAIALDQSGNVYIAGTIDSPNFPTTIGAYDRSYNGGSWDGFISKLSDDLSQLLASTFIGGSDYEEIGAITIDSSGNVYIAGVTQSNNFPTTPGAYDASYNGYYDGFVSKLSSNLNQLLVSTFIGGYGRDIVHAIALDNSGNVYIAGRTESTNFPTTAGAYDTSYNGNINGFVSKLSGDLSSASSTQYALTITKTGTGSGIVTSNPAGINCGTDCTESYASGTVVTLTATPDANSIFTGWSGGGCSGTGPCTVTVNAATTVTATFVRTYAITITKTGSTGTGIITSSPAGISCGAYCTGSYPAGTVVSLTAAPDMTSVFAGWSGGGCAGTGICVVTMNAEATITAIFIKTFTITASATAGGTITPSGTVIADYGTDAVFTMTPDAYYHLLDVKADGVSLGTVNTYTFTYVTSDHTIEAIYEQDPPDQVTQTIEDTVSSLPPTDFNNPNNQNTYINKLDAVIALINNGDYQTAIDKLQNDILKKTDGCRNIGHPDNNDWLTDPDCISQSQLYDAVVYLIIQLQGM